MAQLILSSDRPWRRRGKRKHRKAPSNLPQGSVAAGAGGAHPMRAPRRRRRRRSWTRWTTRRPAGCPNGTTDLVKRQALAPQRQAQAPESSQQRPPGVRGSRGGAGAPEASAETEAAASELDTLDNTTPSRMPSGVALAKKPMTVQNFCRLACAQVQQQASVMISRGAHVQLTKAESCTLVQVTTYHRRRPSPSSVVYTKHRSHTSVLRDTHESRQHEAGKAEECMQRESQAETEQQPAVTHMHGP